MTMRALLQALARPACPAPALALYAALHQAALRAMLIAMCPRLVVTIPRSLCRAPCGALLDVIDLAVAHKLFSALSACLGLTTADVVDHGVMVNVMRDLARVVTFANGKGGAGKTSTAVNCAGLAAAAGWRTLLVDMDPQGNAGHDLGYYWDKRTDHGKGLVDAVVGGRALVPAVPQVREHLDVVSGGEALDDLESIITGRAQRSKSFQTMLADAFEPIVDRYDLIVIDTPPTRPNLLQLALAATRWIVVPTRADRASIEGLRLLAHQIEAVRAVNPAVEILGAVLFDVSTSATAVRRNAAEDINNALDGAAPLFEAVIRHGESSAVEAREKGVLVHELAERVDAAEPYWKALKEGRKPTRLPGSAPALAEDYVLLCQEILTRIDQMESAEATTA